MLIHFVNLKSSLNNLLDDLPFIISCFLSFHVNKVASSISSKLWLNMLMTPRVP